MVHTFKDIKLNPDEVLWLKEINNHGVLDVKSTKVQLWGKLSSNFDHRKISRSLYRENHLTLLGMWHLDKNNMMFHIVDQTIRLIQSLIKENPKTKIIYASEVASKLSINEEIAQKSLYLMSELGHFYSGASGLTGKIGYSQISFSENSENAFDEYLSYTSLDDQIEKFHLNHIQASTHGAAAPLPTQNSHPFTPSQPHQESPAFEQLNLQRRFSDHLNYRWLEAKKCYETNAWLAATILYGSILETIFIAALIREETSATASSKAPKRGGNVLDIREWKLESMLNVATSIGMIDSNLAKYAHALRDSRNLIHPIKQVEENSEPDKEIADIARLVTMKVIKALSQRPQTHSNSISLTDMSLDTERL